MAQECFKDLWDTLISSTSVLYFIALAWASVMLLTIFVNSAKLTMIRTLCWIQILGSVSLIGAVFVYWKTRKHFYIVPGDKTTCKRDESRDQNKHFWVAVLLFTIWMICTSLRQVAFSMKNWKIAIILESI